MARLTEDPNLENQPDFNLAEFAPDRLLLVAEGLTDDQAANALGAVWRMENNKAKAQWARQIADDAEEERLAEERRRGQAEHEDVDAITAAAQAQFKLEQEQEKEEARKEDKKRNRIKYNEIKNGVLPDDEPFFPSAYALRKLSKGDYCELFYFTNQGEDIALDCSALDTDPEAMVMVAGANGVNTWIQAGAARNSKTGIIKDEDLEWEQLVEACPRMVDAMEDNLWPIPRLSMFVDFWKAIQRHPWRTSRDPLRKRALLLYQAKQRRRWHLIAGIRDNCSLAEINEKLLNDDWHILCNQDRNKELQSAIAKATQAAIAEVRAAQFTGENRQQRSSLYKRSQSPQLDDGRQLSSYKKPKSFRPSQELWNTFPTARAALPGGEYPPCAVCLGRHRHFVIKCDATRTWDDKFTTFAI
ncbi:hypothetical protein BJ138DRAFT_1131572 [Hygrophoropsis aurantiaca]|uniref:Uncharacterized protein n=1 Tax=Hygrophoropsis aurantiaca TaxID=72124 RepID=A0ACB7ZPX5_9AGAM|nr:hypothetical protein BJ138DRAFT_1131572 [Hygrophoropsis aurantiaca]